VKVRTRESRVLVAAGASGDGSVSASVLEFDPPHAESAKAVPRISSDLERGYGTANVLLFFVTAIIVLTGIKV
jgi:hypothetical protein